MKIALVQSAIVWGEVEENLVRTARKMEECKGCDLIVLPEMFVSGCMMVKKSPVVAEEEKRRVAACYTRVQTEMLAWAAQQQALVMGSTVCEENGRFYNRLIAAFPEGKCLFYDKRHCFRMGGENEHFSAGTKRLVLDFRGVKIAVFVCYDLRFPVWSRNVEGYDLAVYVANWPESRREVWNLLLKARAVENQAYVAGVNCVGTDNNGLKYSGDSALIDGKGQVVAAARTAREEVVKGEIDPEALRAWRAKFPVLDDADRFQLL